MWNWERTGKIINIRWFIHFLFFIMLPMLMKKVSLMFLYYFLFVCHICVLSISFIVSIVFKSWVIWFKKKQSSFLSLAANFCFCECWKFHLCDAVDCTGIFRCDNQDYVFDCSPLENSILILVLNPIVCRLWH